VTDRESQRTHEPDLREVTAELDGLREVLIARLEGVHAVIEERDKLYKERAESLRDATEQSRAALERQTIQAFASAEKAIDKAETAQRAYNERSNEFRAALDDAQKTLITRVEASGEFNRYAERIEDIKKEIISLRESRKQVEGATTAVKAMWAVLGVLIGAAFSILGLLNKGG